MRNAGGAAGNGTFDNEDQSLSSPRVHGIPYCGMLSSGWQLVNQMNQLSFPTSTNYLVSTVKRYREVEHIISFCLDNFQCGGRQPQNGRGDISRIHTDTSPVHQEEDTVLFKLEERHYLFFNIVLFVFKAHVFVPFFVPASTLISPPATRRPTDEGPRDSNVGWCSAAFASYPCDLRP